MKKLISLFALFILSTSIYGQSTFNKLELFLNSNNNSSEFFGNITILDNYIFGEVAIFDSINQPYTGIVKLNINGDLISKNFLQYSGARIATYQNQNFISTSDSNLVLCSNLRFDSTANWDGYLVKLDTNLDTLWTRVYDLPSNLANCTDSINVPNFFTAIKETPDKGFIITGNYQRHCINNMTNQRSFLLKVDSVGNVQWWKVYHNVKHLYDIELTDDGGYVIINKYGYSKFAKLDSLGNIQWQTSPSSYMTYVETGDITPIGNGEYIVTYTYAYNNNERNGVITYKININTQQIIWEKAYQLYHDVHCLSLNQVMGVEVNNSGDIIVWATSHVIDRPYGGGKRAAVLKLNSQGDSLWAKYYDSPNCTWYDELQLNDLIITDDGGFLGVGYQYFYDTGRVMAWLFKTDSNGVIGWDTSTPLSVPSLRVYPNPATDFTNIEFGNELNKEANIEVYNSLGQLVLFNKIAKGEQAYRLELKSLNSGIYFFGVFDDKLLLGGGKFVKE